MFQKKKKHAYKLTSWGKSGESIIGINITKSFHLIIKNSIKERFLSLTI